MDRSDRAWLRWWLVAALLIVVVRLLSGCAPHQPVVTVAQRDGTVVKHDTVYAFYPTVLELDSTSRNDGVVECAANNVPYIRIKRVFFPDSMARLRRLLLVHEETHVAQGIASGNCNEWRRSIAASAETRFLVESQAYCAVYIVEEREKQPHWWSKAQIAEFLQRTIYPAISVEEALVRLPCELPP